MSRLTLTTAVAVAAVTIASPAGASSCPLVADRAGDGVPSLFATAAPNAPELDILAVDIASGPSTVVTELAVADLDPAVRSPSAGTAVEYGISFQVGGRRYGALVRLPAVGAMTVNFYDNGQGAAPDGLTATVDTTTDRIRVTVPRSLVSALDTDSTFQFLTGSTHVELGIVTTNADAAVDHTATYRDRTRGCVAAD